jgi:O-methyltransferase involved in polyketide biosynthesis
MFRCSSVSEGLSVAVTRNFSLSFNTQRGSEDLTTEDRPSQTAEGVCIQRALHQTLDNDPKILDDPVAMRLVDPSSDFYKSLVEGLERMPAAIRLQRRAYTMIPLSRVALL